jgi:hypothetical protein
MATYIQIGSVSVGSGGAASMSFSSIPSTYTDLVCKLSVRGDSLYNVLMSINGSTTNFLYRLIEGDGASAASYANTTGRLGNTLVDTANTFSSIDLYIPNYAGSNNKSYSVDAVSEANVTTAYTDLTAGLWSNVTAISSLSFSMSTGNFTQYSTATLYGISKS